MKKNVYSFIICSIILICVTGGSPGSLSKAIAKSPQDFTQPGFSHWRQVNTDGFGNPSNGSVLALEIFNNELYAASNNWVSGTQIWRLQPTGGWLAVSQPGFGGEYGNLNPAVADMIVFNGNLYAGTGWGGASSQVWRSATGTAWNQVVADGFGYANVVISPFGIFNGMLYASVENLDDGMEIWRTSTGNVGEWEEVVTAGNGNPNNDIATSLTQFGDYFYAAVENTTDGAQVWRTDDGETWLPVSTGGFGDINNIQTGGMAIYNGYLYVGTRNNVTGAQLFRSSDGTNWEPVIEDGFGDVSNFKIEMVYEWNGSLFAGTDNNLTGVEIWQSNNGQTWNQVNQDGFGDTNIRATLWNSSTLTYRQFMYIGTENQVSGGEIWKNLGYIQYLPVTLH
jgi:hypothetical protein